MLYLGVVDARATIRYDMTFFFPHGRWGTIRKNDACYDTGNRLPYFGLFCLLNDGAPEPKIVGKKKNNRPFFWPDSRSIPRRPWDDSSGSAVIFSSKESLYPTVPRGGSFCAKKSLGSMEFFV